MQDVLVQLDASFDQQPVHIIVAWLRHRDAQVTIGEPLAIIQAGDTRKVISAPCSGRIVAIYADPGAPLLPQSIIASIRPGLPLAIPVRSINTILVALALIAVVVVIVPTINGISNQPPTPVVPTTTTNAARSWWPFDDTPQPTRSASQTTQIPEADVDPTVALPPDPNALAPDPNALPPDPTPAPPPSQELPSTVTDSLVKRIGSLINEMITLTLEIQPWVQTNRLINPQIYQQMINPRVARNQIIIEKLYMIANANSANSALTPLEQQLLSQLDQFIAPCTKIHEDVQLANEISTIPSDLDELYNQCISGSDNLVQYFGGQ